MKSIFRKLFLIFFLLFLCAGLFFFLNKTPKSNISSVFDPIKITGRNIYTQCEINIGKAYECYKQASLYAIENGYKASELITFAPFAKISHLLEHSIGRALLIDSNYDLEKAREKCLPRCMGSYYHAFAEEWSDYAPDRLPEFKSFLTKYCPLDQDARVACYHNLGHFYIGSAKNLEKSFKLCDEFKRDDQFTQCAYGVVHEQLIRSGTQNFFEQCSSYSGRIKEQCFVIGSRLYPLWHSNEIEFASPLKLCNDLNSQIPQEFNRCYRAIAWVIKDRKKNISVLSCDSVASQFKSLCEAGIISPQPFWDVLGCGISDENDEVGSVSCRVN